MPTGLRESCCCARHSAYAGELVVDVSRTMDDLSEDQYLAGQHIAEHTATVDRIEALTHDIRWLGTAPR